MNKILLVDDDRELTSLLKELLEMEGFTIVVAYDAEEKRYRYVERAASAPPDAGHHADRPRQ